MSNLPRISGKECIKILMKIGFYLRRQEGSHMIMRKESPFMQVVVPDHSELCAGTLRAIIRQIGISVDDFKKLL